MQCSSKCKTEQQMGDHRGEVTARKKRKYRLSYRTPSSAIWRRVLRHGFNIPPVRLLYSHTRCLLPQCLPPAVLVWTFGGKRARFHAPSSCLTAGTSHHCKKHQAMSRPACADLHLLFTSPQGSLEKTLARKHTTISSNPAHYQPRPPQGQRV